jgi:hypothetical protein
MPSKLATAAAVVMALYCPTSTFAEARISVSSSSVPKVEASRRVVVLEAPSDKARIANSRLEHDADGQAVRSIFEITSTSKTDREVIVPIRVMRGARVVAMSATVGGRSMSTSPMITAYATARYEAIVERYNDPVLLEHRAVDDATGEDVLRLRVFPVSAERSAQIELTVELPHERDWMLDDTATRFVAPGTSLLAVERRAATSASEAGLPSVVSCGGYVVHPSGDLDKATIRRYMKRQLPRVKGCYDHALLSDATLAAKVGLHFTIGNDGRTHDVSVDGDIASESLRSCIASELAGFEFPEVPTMAGTIQINYPVELRPE